MGQGGHECLKGKQTEIRAVEINSWFLPPQTTDHLSQVLPEAVVIKETPH